MDNKFTQIGIQYSSFGDNAQIEVQQTIIVPRKSTPIPSDVRQGSPNFVGRVDDLRGLHEALQKEKIVSVCAVRGMGGVGKTELAIQYALSKEFQQRYVACYWFSLNEGNLASLVLQKAAPYLAMPEEIQKSDDVYEQVKWCWQNWHPPEGEVLVILDDVKSLDDIPKQAMPINPRFKVMLTTRQGNLSPSFRELQLVVLPENEALELLKRIVDRDGSSRIESELETAKEICRYLGYLPLALELVAIYLVEDEMLTLGKYWQQLNLQDRSISDEMVKYITAERGVVSAFALSWLRLRDLSPQVAMLLGRFAPADIPWQDLVEPTVKSLGWDEAAVRKGLIQLANLHLISIREQKDIQINSLLREYFRWQGDLEGDDFIHFLQRSIVTTGISISKAIPENLVKADFERIQPAIPHLELLNREMLKDTPQEDLEWTFLGVGRYYSGQGLYASALVSSQACLVALEERLGSDHPKTAISLHNLACTYYYLCQYSEAELLLQRALQIMEQQFGADHPEIVNTLTSLAKTNKCQGRYSEAELLLQRALQILQLQLLPYFRDIVGLICSLGSLYKAQGRYSEAEPLYEQYLQIHQQLGFDHVDAAMALNNLASLYKDQGRYSEAEPLYEQSLQIHENQLGVDHPKTALSLNNLASLYQAQGQYSEAEPLLKRSLQIKEQKLGVDHPKTTESINNLASLYYFQSRYSEAEPLLKRSLQIHENQLGVDHPTTALSLNNLGELYRVQGRYSEAEPLLRRSLQIREQKLGGDHPDNAQNLNNLALLYQAQGRYSEAEPLLQQSLQIHETQLGIDHPNTAQSLYNLALLYWAQRRYSECKPLLQRSLEIAKDSLGEDHHITQAIRTSLRYLHAPKSRLEAILKFLFLIPLLIIVFPFVLLPALYRLILDILDNLLKIMNEYLYPTDGDKS
jgi:tetratricopeptide (TPR) repeat protein